MSPAKISRPTPESQRDLASLVLRNRPLHLAIATGLLLAPFLAVAWYEAGVRLLSDSEAAVYLRDGGSIRTQFIEGYRTNLIGFAQFGILSAVIIGGLVYLTLRRAQRSNDDPA